jgi:hypothetical protein
MKVPVIHFDVYDEALTWEEFELTDEDTGDPILLTSDGTSGGVADKARATIFDPNGGNVLWTAQSDDVNAQISITPLSGKIQLMPDFSSAGPQSWPDGAKIKIDRLRNDGAVIPFARGTAKLNK